MKFEIIKKWNLEELKVSYIFSSIVLDNGNLVILTSEKDHYEKYLLLIIDDNSINKVELDYISEKTERDYPVLIKIQNGFGVMKTINEIYLYENTESKPQIIQINNKKFFGKIIPSSAQKRYNKSITETEIHPIQLENSVYYGDTRLFGLLKFNKDKKEAKWIKMSAIDNSAFPFHKDKKYSPKIDSLKIKENRIFAFVSGGKITSVNKWGMDYYGLVEISDKGKVIDTLISSEDLHTKYSKKKGVNGKFTYSNFVILQQVFASDTWKGKQKLYSLDTKEYIDINLPRGMNKYKIEQIDKNVFWTYLLDGNLKEIKQLKVI